MHFSLFKFLVLPLLLSTGSAVLQGCDAVSNPAVITPVAVPIAVSMHTAAYFQVSFLREPSGIVFHPHRNSLFAVSDEGSICELSTDGTKKNMRTIRPADFEGITVNPASGKLYIAVEGEEKVLQVDPVTLSVEREFSIDRSVNGAVVLAPGGQGIEAITYIPGTSATDQVTCVIANQGSKNSNPQDSPALFEISLPVHTSSIVRISRFLPISFSDVSGLHYDPASGNLVVISDRNNRIFEFTRDAKLVRSHHLLGKDQEGIAIDNNGYIYIAQDSGGILKCKRTPGKKKP